MNPKGKGELQIKIPAEEPRAQAKGSDQTANQLEALPLPWLQYILGVSTTRASQPESQSGAGPVVAMATRFVRTAHALAETQSAAAART